jgi:hypothetical protein
MARPKRMGAYNALDDLLPGGAWGPEASPRLEPVPDPPRPSRRRPPSRPADRNALDDLLPGPRSLGDVEDRPLGPSASSRRRRGTMPRGRRAGRHLGAWNPLDDLPASPGTDPAPAPAKTRISMRLPADLVETARDAVAHLAATADRTTLTALTERALRTELARMAASSNHGRPFPPRAP